jgi:transposase
LPSKQKIQGRKRHLLVDVNGLVLAVKVQAANILDRHGAPLLLGPLAHRFPRLQLIWADSGYNGKCREWIKEHLGVEVEIVNHRGPVYGFPPLAGREVLEKGNPCAEPADQR